MSEAKVYDCDYYYDWINGKQNEAELKAMVGYLLIRGFSEWGTSDSPAPEGYLIKVDKANKRIKFFVDLTVDFPELTLDLSRAGGQEIKLLVDSSNIHEAYEKLRTLVP